MDISLPFADVTHIDPELLSCAGASGFRPKSPAYRTPVDNGSNVLVVPIRAVRPPLRNRGVKGLHDDRLDDLLKKIVEDTAIDPIEAFRINDHLFEFGVSHGYHRFYASAVLQFSHVPLIVKPFVSIYDL